jgi:hypothetical protein
MICELDCVMHVFFYALSCNNLLQSFFLNMKCYIASVLQTLFTEFGLSYMNQIQNGLAVAGRHVQREVNLK